MDIRIARANIRRSGPDAEGDLEDSPLFEGIEAAGRVPAPFPVFRIDEVDCVSRRDFPAETGVDAQFVRIVVVLNIIQKPQPGREIEIGLELVDVLLEVPLGETSADEIGVEPQGRVALELELDPGLDIVIMPGIKIPELPFQVCGPGPVGRGLELDAVVRERVGARGQDDAVGDFPILVSRTPARSQVKENRSS